MMRIPVHIATRLVGDMNIHGVVRLLARAISIDMRTLLDIHRMHMLLPIISIAR